MEDIKLINCLRRRHNGRINAANSPVLEARFNISGRAIREIVNEMRCQGHPICSDENGYYYASSAAELSATIKKMNSQISTIAKARNGLVRAMKLYIDDGQTSIPL